MDIRSVPVIRVSFEYQSVVRSNGFDLERAAGDDMARSSPIVAVSRYGVLGHDTEKLVSKQPDKVRGALFEGYPEREVVDRLDAQVFRGDGHEFGPSDGGCQLRVGIDLFLAFLFVALDREPLGFMYPLCEVGGRAKY